MVLQLMEDHLTADVKFPSKVFDRLVGSSLTYAIAQQIFWRKKFRRECARGPLIPGMTDRDEPWIDDPLVDGHEIDSSGKSILLRFGLPWLFQDSGIAFEISPD